MQEREGGKTASSFLSRVTITVSFDPSIREPLPFRPKTKMEAQSQSLEGGGGVM